MRQALPAILLALGLAGPALADTTLVRSAEHDGFTRIVVDFERRPDWRLEPVPDGVRLVAGSTDYDLGGIYRRIYRDRVTEIREDGDGALLISFGCDCTVSTFELPNQGLMLDVMPADPDAVPRVAVELPGHNELEPLPARLLPGAFADLADADPEEMRRVASLRDAVASEFARGAAQGLVDVEPLPPAPAPEPEPVPIVETAAQDLTVPAYPNLRIETRIDRDNPHRSPALDDPTCVAVPDLEIASWGKPEMLETGLGDLYLRQSSETGVPDAEAQRELARALVYMTFGAEARSVLRAAPSDMPDLAILREIASLMDAPVAAPELAEFVHCAPMAAIFNLISQEPAPSGDLKGVVATLSALPIHMRRHLGPRLAEALVEAGHVEEADSVRVAIERGGPVETADSRIAEAKLAIKRRPETVDPADLMPVVEARAPRAAEALTLLLDHSVATGRPVPRATLDQAIALSFETGGEEGRALDVALVGAFLDAGAFEDAARRLDALALQPDDRSVALEAAFFERIVTLSDPAEFLTMAAKFEDRRIERPDMRLRMADRLTALGLGALARRYLDQSDEIPAADERLLRARIATSEGKPDIAESYLAGLFGAEVDAVREDIAGLRQGDPETAEDAVVADGVVPQPGLAERNRALLDRSAALRSELSGLLDP